MARAREFCVKSSLSVEKYRVGTLIFRTAVSAKMDFMDAGGPAIIWILALRNTALRAVRAGNTSGMGVPPARPRVTSL
jgi:hypothetical protein